MGVQKFRSSPGGPGCLGFVGPIFFEPKTNGTTGPRIPNFSTFGVGKTFFGGLGGLVICGLVNFNDVWKQNSVESMGFFFGS